jgi:D-alanyl-D-alanine endopeptidase (penicillin-binding protein 7)
MSKLKGALFLIVAGLFLPFASWAVERAPVLVPGAQLYDRADDEFAAAIVVDAATGKRLYAYKPDLKWPAASLSKLVSALVILDGNPAWSKVVSLKQQDDVGGGNLRLPAGSMLSIRDLFYSSIVGSANNATMALARLSGFGLKGFVKKMNQKAKTLDMASSSFYEPTGMEPKNTLTAADAVKLARAAFSLTTLRRAASTGSYQFTVRNAATVKRITNTNVLLTQDPDVWVLGGKTGFLYEARYNLIVQMRAYPQSERKPPLYVVVLGSPKKEASFATAKSLANWAYKAYNWQPTP